MLARTNRLTSGDEIRDVIKRGQRFSTAYFTLHFVPANHSRFAVITGKTLGNAVQRNKIKRRVTNAVRELLPEANSNLEGVFRMRAKALDCDFVDLSTAVREALKRL